MGWGKKEEDYAKEQFEKQGYTVLNQNDRGFPDLIAIKDGKIAFFVQVKSNVDTKPFVSDRERRYEESLKKLGYEVKYINVKPDGKMVQYYE